MPDESPDGRYGITFHEHEAFNSHWVRTPTITDKTSGGVMLAIHDTRWSVDEAEWRDDSVVKLVMRKYPGNHEPGDITVVVDCRRGTAAVGEGAPVSLAALEPAMDRALTWIYAKPAAPAPAPGWRAALRRLFKGY